MVLVVLVVEIPLPFCLPFEKRSVENLFKVKLCIKKLNALKM